MEAQSSLVPITAGCFGGPIDIPSVEPAPRWIRGQGPVTPPGTLRWLVGARGRGAHGAGLTFWAPRVYGSAKRLNFVGVMSISPDLRLRVTRSVTFVSGHPVVGTPKNGKESHRRIARDTWPECLRRGRRLTCAGGPGIRPAPMRGQQCAPSLVGPRPYPTPWLPTDFELPRAAHPAARLARRSGANIKALQNMLGHASAAPVHVGSLRPNFISSDVDTVGQAIDAEITVLVGTVWARGMPPGPSRTGVQCLTTCNNIGGRGRYRTADRWCVKP